MKVLLVYPPVYSTAKYGKLPMPAPAPGLGLGYVAAVLLQAGHEVKVSDMFYRDSNQVLQEIMEYEPQLVGITCLTEQRAGAFEVARLVKSVDSSACVVLGGHHPTYMPQQVIESPFVDIIVLGEGEVTTLALVEALERGKDLAQVEGIIYKKGQNVIFTHPRELIKDLDTIPFPPYHQFNLDSYPRQHEIEPTLKTATFKGHRLIDYFTNGSQYVSLITSRGCPYRCQFCSTTLFWGRRWRFRSASNVLEEMDLLYHQFNVRYFSFADDAATVNQKRMIEICQGIIDRGFDIAWDCTTRVNWVSPEMLKWMRKAGCYRISFGVESGSQKILETIGKKQSIDQIVAAFEMAHHVGIHPSALLMVGNPGETHETIQETIDLVRRIKPYGVGVSITLVFPGTELYELSKAQGLINDDYWLTNGPAPYYTVEHGLDVLRKWKRMIEYSTMPATGKLVRVARDLAESVTGLEISRQGIARKVHNQFKSP